MNYSKVAVKKKLFSDRDERLHFSSTFAILGTFPLNIMLAHGSACNHISALIAMLANTNKLVLLKWSLSCI